MAHSEGKPRRRRGLWQRIGLLSFVTLFFVSALLRIGAMGMAIASVAPTNHSSGSEGNTGGSSAVAETDCANSGALDLALTRVDGRAEELDAREARLNDRAQALSEVEARIQAQMAALVETEGRLESLMSLSDTAAEDDLARLTQVYETMGSADAAALFTQMDPSFAAGFLGRMHPDAAAGIMTELDPNVAYSISVLLATRNASAQTTDSAN